MRARNPHPTPTAKQQRGTPSLSPLTPSPSLAIALPPAQPCDCASSALLCTQLPGRLIRACDCSKLAGACSCLALAFADWGGTHASSSHPSMPHQRTAHAGLTAMHWAKHHARLCNAAGMLLCVLLRRIHISLHHHARSFRVVMHSQCSTMRTHDQRTIASHLHLRDNVNSEGRVNNGFPNKARNTHQDT